MSDEVEDGEKPKRVYAFGAKFVANRKHGNGYHAHREQRRLNMLLLSIERIEAKVKRCRTEATRERWQNELDGMHKIRRYVQAQIECAGNILECVRDKRVKIRAYEIEQRERQML